MRILIVDDNQEKSATIEAALLSGLTEAQSVRVDAAGDLSSAVRCLTANAYDLIVLDLMLPYIAGGLAVAGAGTELLKQVRSVSGLNLHSLVVGLSEYPDEVTSARDDFEKHGVLLVKYDEDARWRSTLIQLRDDVLARAEPTHGTDFLIMVALREELDGLRQTDLRFKGAAIRNGLNVELVELPGSTVRQGAIVLLRQMGLTAATLDTAIAIGTFKPTVVGMTGICAGLAGEVNLGQLVLATPAWEYQSGKWSEDDFLIAPYQIPLRPGTRVLAEQVLGRLNMDEMERGLDFALKRPAVRSKPTLAPGATGSAVIADKSRLEHIDKQHRKLAVIDMESFGVYLAAHESALHVPHYFSLKAVVDLADSDKADDLHEYGAIVSGRAAVKVLSAIFETS